MSRDDIILSEDTAISLCLVNTNPPLDVPRIPTDVAGRALLTHIALVYASRCAFQNRDARSACERVRHQTGKRIRLGM